MSSARTATRRRAPRRAGAGTGGKAPARGTRRRRPVAGRRRTRPGAGKRTSRRGLGRVAGRWWPAVLVAVAVLAGVAWHSAEAPAPVLVGTCSVKGTTLTLTGEQATNAATIARVGRDRGLPERAVVIALATAQQESRLRNLDHGDRDSLGLFQQRPSQGWGTPAQVRDPVYAAGRFYDHLVAVPHWQTGRLTDVSQAVQRSGFPEAYQRHEAMAVALAKALAPRATTLICR